MATHSSKEKLGANCRLKTEMKDCSTGKFVFSLGAQRPGKVCRARNDTGKTRSKTACSLSTPPSPTRYRPRRETLNAPLHPCVRLYSRTYGLVAHGDRACQRPGRWPGSRRATVASAGLQRSRVLGPMASLYPQNDRVLTHPNSTSTSTGAAMLRKPS